MRIAIYGKEITPESRIYLEKLHAKFKEAKVSIYINERFNNFLIEKCDLNLQLETYTDHLSFLAIQPDILLTIGGDGTLLDSATLVRDSNIPIMGINTGRLGFLTSIQKENIQEAISQINENKFSVIKRTLLEVKSNSINNAFSDYPFALNEITIQRKDTTSLLNISCQINGNYLTNYWSDGLIISTPTGSTGYSLSNGGSIVSPESNVILLNPIAPHNINMRSLVIPNNSKINIDIEGDSDINLSVDSRMYSVNCSNQIEIFKADFTIGTIKFDNDNFYKRLREKLFWGQDMRNKNTKK